MNQSWMVQVRDPHQGELRWEMAYDISGQYTPRKNDEQIGFAKNFQGWVADQFITADRGSSPVAVMRAPPQPELCPRPKHEPPSRATVRLGDDVSSCGSKERTS